MFSRDTLMLDTGDLWAGGMETVVSTVAWALLQLVHQPHIQRQLQSELDSHLGNHPFEAGGSDRLALPYFRAFIDELQRWANVLPWHLPHALSAEWEVCGKRIPAGTTIMCQFGAVHFDPEVFPDPERFDPTRFIDPATGNYRPIDCVKPFGLGKRRCLGEQLAKVELEAVLAALVQNFEFFPQKGGLPSLERLPGMTSKPGPFKCRVKKRREELIISA